MQDKLEGSVWSRRGRAGRGRGSSRASVITHAMQNGALAMQPAQRPEGPASLPDGYPHQLVKTKQDEFCDKSHADSHQHHINTESNTAPSTSYSGQAPNAQNEKAFLSSYGPSVAPYMNQPGASSPIFHASANLCGDGSKCVVSSANACLSLLCTCSYASYRCFCPFRASSSTS